MMNFLMDPPEELRCGGTRGRNTTICARAEWSDKPEVREAPPAKSVGRVSKGSPDPGGEAESEGCGTAGE